MRALSNGGCQGIMSKCTSIEYQGALVIVVHKIICVGTMPRMGMHDMIWIGTMPRVGMHGMIGMCDGMCGMVGICMEKRVCGKYDLWTKHVMFWWVSTIWCHVTCDLWNVRDCWYGWNVLEWMECVDFGTDVTIGMVGMYGMCDLWNEARDVMMNRHENMMNRHYLVSCDGWTLECTWLLGGMECGMTSCYGSRGYGLWTIEWYIRGS